MAFVLNGRQRQSLDRLASWAWRQNRALAALVAIMLALGAVSLIGLAVDPRLITGAPAWMKPLKFAISIAIYGATLLWLLTYVRERTRLVAAVSWAVFLFLGYEMALIVLQVLRGTTSHFNQATAFDATVFRIMGTLISALWFLNLGLAVFLSRKRFASPPLVWSVRLGLIGGLLGMAVAVLMVLPTPEQSALIAAQGSSPIIGAHSIGVSDGGPGLPIVGWSTVGGDLRVAHFVGLHALQGLPLIALLIGRRTPAWLSVRHQTRLVGIAGIGWIGLTLLVTWQALRGQPLLAPDAASGAGLAALAACIVVASGLVLWRARREALRESGANVTIRCAVAYR